MSDVYKYILTKMYLSAEYVTNARSQALNSLFPLNNRGGIGCGSPKLPMQT